MLITQHLDGDIYGIALATHQTYFKEDKMQWLKDYAEAIDWTSCPFLREQVRNYDPFAPEKVLPIDSSSNPDAKDDEPPDDIPF